MRLIVVISILLSLFSSAFAANGEQREVTMMPVNISRQTQDNYQVDIVTVGERQTLSLQASQLIENIRKINRAVPSALLEKRQDKVSLDELTEMGFYCRFDEVKVQIDMSLPADLNNPEELSIGGEREFFREGEMATAEPLSGYVNTSAMAGFRRDQQANHYADPFRARFDGVLNFHGYVLEGSGTAQTESPFQRDDIRVTKEMDKFGGMRVSVGDLFYPVLGYQSYRKTGGVSAYTIRDQKQGFLSNRTSAKQIEVKQPSTLTFFVNEQPVATRKVLPGLFDISDIPMSTGVNRIRVLVEADGTGQREEISFDDFFSDYGIKRGQRDFAVALGDKSTDLNGQRSYDSDHRTLMLNHRYDHTNRFSWSQYFQGDGDAQIAGMIEAFHVPGGYVQLDSAASNLSGTGGVAARLGYFKTRPDEFFLFRGDRYNLNFEKRGNGFAQLDANPRGAETNINGAYTFPTWKRFTVGIGGAYGRMDDTGNLTYSYSGNLSRGFGNFYVTANASQRYTETLPNELTLGLSLNWSPGERSYYLNTQQTGRSQSTTHLAMNTSRDQDVKGSITETTDRQSITTQTQVTGTTNRNEITFSGNRTESRFDHSYIEHFSLNTRFAVAFAGRKIAVGRPISDSFFLTDTKHATREYQLQTWGRHSETGAMGEALVGFQNYPMNSARVYSGDPYGNTFDTAGVFNVEHSWKNGYLLKIKEKISPTVISIKSKDLDSLKNSLMHLKRVETSEVTDFFVSSEGEVFLEGIEGGLYEFEIGKHSGRFELDLLGGRRVLDFTSDK